MCEDPGHPPDGQQIAISYEQGAEVQFACLRPGYEPQSDEPIRCDKSNFFTAHLLFFCSFFVWLYILISLNNKYKIEIPFFFFL